MFNHKKIKAKFVYLIEKGFDENEKNPGDSKSIIEVLNLSKSFLDDPKAEDLINTDIIEKLSIECYKSLHFLSQGDDILTLSQEKYGELIEIVQKDFPLTGESYDENIHIIVTGFFSYLFTLNKEYEDLLEKRHLNFFTVMGLIYFLAFLNATIESR